MAITFYKNYSIPPNSTGVPATRTRYALVSKIGLLAGGGAAAGAGGAERLRQILGATANWIPKARPRTRPPGPGRRAGTGGRARGQGPGAQEKCIDCRNSLSLFAMAVGRQMS